MLNKRGNIIAKIDIHVNAREHQYLLPGVYLLIKLSMKTGRYRGEALSDRLCIFCSSNNVEDECHFLLHCTAYSNLRSTFFTNTGFNPTVIDMSDFNKTKFLVSEFPRQTANFLYLSYTYRQSIIYTCTKRHA